MIHEKIFRERAKKLISIVIPCYNEQEVIAETLGRLAQLCGNLAGYDFEIICVDDGSRDKTYDLLCAAAESRPELRIVKFSRNFGHQIAVTAGIDASAGDAVVLMDCDLQDPPEVVAQMIGKWEEGFDVVYGVRASRAGESAFKLVTARSFYRFLNTLSEVPIPLDTGDFRLMSRPVVDVLKAMPERHRFVRGMVAWIGFKQTALPYERMERFAGESKYPLRKMVRFAMDGILSFSTKPLRLAVGLGLASAAVAMLGITYALALRIFSSVWVEGWTALMIAVLFMGGVQLVSLGIIGEYIGRIYSEVKRRPLYIVGEKVGFDDPLAPTRKARSKAFAAFDQE